MLQTSVDVSDNSSPGEIGREIRRNHQDVIVATTLHSACGQGAGNRLRSKSRSSGGNNNREPAESGVPPLYPASLGSPLAREPEVAVLEAAQEQRLIELLHRASQTIKEERARSAALRQEVEELRQSTSTLSTVQILQQENQHLRRQLASMRKQLERSQSHNPQTREREREREREKQQSSGKDGSLSSCRGDGTSSKRSSVKVPLMPFSTNTGTPMTKSYSDVEHTKQRAVLLQRQSQLSPGDTPRGHGVTETQTQNQQQRSSSDDAAADTAVTNCKWRSVIPHDGETTYNAEMVTRLRRALAPPPTKEQLGEVIHAMVREILRDTHRRGLDLYIKRQAPCVYRCTFGNEGTQKGKAVAARVVHLSIDSGRLTVKVGGGHVNFLSYLEQNCASLSLHRL